MPKTRTAVISLSDAVGGTTRPSERTAAFVEFRRQVKEQVAAVGGTVKDVGGNRLRVTFPVDEAAPEALERAHEVDPESTSTPEVKKKPSTRKAPAKKATKKSTAKKKAPAKRAAKKE